MIEGISSMNAAERDKFRLLIAAQLTALDEEDARGRDSQSVVALDQQAVGRLSRMDALQAQAMAKANQTRRDSRKRALHAALRRLEIEGEAFGFCQACGEPIARKRLDFDPSVIICIRCAAG